MIKALLPLAAALALAPAMPALAQAVCYDDGYSVVNLGSMCGGWREIAAPASRPTAQPARSQAPAVARTPVAQIPESAEAPQEAAVVELDFAGSMAAAGYSLMAGNLATSAPTVHYDVWKNRDGLDYLYFIWSNSPGSGMDNRSDPDVVVRFMPTDKVARVNNDVAQACFFGSGSFCNTASLGPTVVVPTHRRTENPGNCMFPWQSASDGSRCGGRAAVAREGGF